MYEDNLPQRRYNQTLQFLQKNLPNHAKIIDFGVVNPLSKQMTNKGYQVTNTGEADLDEYIFHANKKYDCATAFEILEHLLNPYTLLKEIPADHFCATIPLNLWYSKAYRNPKDPRDRHYHEFEDWQFDWLLEKTGWKIIDREKWTNPTKKIGIRPFLRTLTPRYYAVFAKRK